jgi:putative nucleotidyltransferase with HDIG domain
LPEASTAVPSEAFAPPTQGITASAAYTPFGGLSRVFRRCSPADAGPPLSLGIRVFAISLVLAVASLSAVLLANGARIHGPAWGLFGLCLVALIAERQSIHVTSYAQVSVSGLPLLFAAVVFGPFEAMLVGACAMIGDFGRPRTRWVIWTASRALVGALAALAAAAIPDSKAAFGTLALAVAIAAVTEATTDIGLATITAWLRRKPPIETLRTMGVLAFAAVPLYAPVIAVLAYAYVAFSPWTALLFFVPAVAAQRLFVLYQEQRQLAHDLATANDRLEGAGLSFATALVAALDARDQYTAGHSACVAVYAKDIAARLGLSEEEQHTAHLAGLVHDIGKVGLPAGLLEKPGALTLEERRIMEEHSTIGERILSNVDGYGEIAKIVRHHHERVDGQGYPDRIPAEDAPLISRIIAVADAYDAMTSGRPYRDAMPSRVARMRLAAAVGTQFDTTVVAAFEAILATADDDYLIGAREDFGSEVSWSASVAAAVG